MKSIRIICLILLGLATVGCSSDDDAPAQVNETEVISDVSLTFTDVDGHEKTYTYTDPNYRTDDYVTPVITLDANKTYQVSTHFYDKSDPDDIEDVTEEVTEEKNDHFVEYRFSNVDINLTRTDTEETTDDNGIKIGLFTQWKTANSAGEGSVRVHLIHKPQSKDITNPEGSHTGGETDAQVDFDLVIQ